MMVEVFRTNITDAAIAATLVALVSTKFPGYSATFDLEDCDHILCVKSVDSPVAADCLIAFLKERGCIAELLPDEIPTGGVLLPQPVPHQ